MSALVDTAMSAADPEAVDALTVSKAMLNILEDIAEENARFDSTYRAVLNILEDSAQEKSLLAASQSAVLNVLEDAADDKARLKATQRAALNILDDFDVEKRKVEKANVELTGEIAERSRVELALRR